MKRSLSIAGHQTSISLEETFWRSLKEISIQKDISIPQLVEEIDGQQRDTGLSSAIRVYILNHYRRELQKRN